MLAVEREYLCEEIKKCSLCRKWIEGSYIVRIYGIRNKYYHHKCYKLLIDNEPSNYLVCFACDEPIGNDGVYEIYNNNIQLFHNTCCNILFRKTNT